MKAILSLLLICAAACANAQCPTLNGAMVNSCGASEGVNEFVVITAGVTANASSYNLQYTTGGTNLSGMDAAAPTGTGTFINCAFTPVTSPSASIPAGSRIIIIPSDFDHVGYSLASLCAGPPIYIIYVNRTGPNSNWATGGNLGNTGGVKTVTLQCSAGGCAGVVRNYTPSSGWPSNADGNFVSWNASGTPAYTNNGCSAVVLPVAYARISAVLSGGKNIVSWQTGQEDDMQHFIIEKSNNGISFSSSGLVSPKGNNSDYSFEEANGGIPITYYRIAGISNDGSRSLSAVATVRNNAARKLMECYPKPSSGILYIEFESAISSSAKLMIYDAAGRMILQENILCSSGHNKKQLDISSYTSGQYYIQVITSGDKLEDSFIKL